MSPFKRAGTPARRKTKWNIVHFIIYFAPVCYKTVNSRPGEKKRLHPPAGKKSTAPGEPRFKRDSVFQGLRGRLSIPGLQSAEQPVQHNHSRRAQHHLGRKLGIGQAVQGEQGV